MCMDGVEYTCVEGIAYTVQHETPSDNYYREEIGIIREALLRLWVSK